MHAFPAPGQEWSEALQLILQLERIAPESKAPSQATIASGASKCWGHGMVQRGEMLPIRLLSRLDKRLRNFVCIVGQSGPDSVIGSPQTTNNSTCKLGLFLSIL